MKNGTRMFLVKLISEERNYFSIGKDYTNSVSIVVHSDTLFSAICNNFRKIFGKGALEDLLKKLVNVSEQDEPLFMLSSCFHYIDIYKQGELFKTIYFLPRPLIRFPLDKASQEYLNENPKLFKKVKFISFEVAKKLQQNEQISLSQSYVLDGKYLIDDKDLKDLGLVELKERVDQIIRKKISIYEILEEQKVRINRKSQESEPFTWPKLKFRTSKYYINDSEEVDYELIPGFYFIFDYSKTGDELASKIKASIKLIIDEGLGGKRSLGCGLVDNIEIRELSDDFEYCNLFNTEKEGYLVNLSLVYPSIEELRNVEYFNIYGRSGYVYSAENISARFNDVKIIEEGAVFNKKIRGKLIQVASEDFVSKYHAVYKNGIGFYINIGKIEVD